VSAPAFVRVCIDVDVDPATAFTVFTDEIDQWYRRGRHTVYAPDRALGIRFEPGVGGRFLEVYDQTTGDGREIGRITVWEPGERLVFVDARDTEVEVTFVAADADGTSTLVTLEHRGFEKLTDAAAEHKARFGWRLMVPWYEEHIQQRSNA
jgi:uncharacterized protein YndB with AHSA1/START domain